MRRRSVLKSITVLPPSIGVAGCIDAFQGENELQVGGIYMANWIPSDHVAHLKIIANDESVFSTTVEVPPFDEEENVVGGKLVDCEWPSEPDTYRLEASIEGIDDTVSVRIGDDEATVAGAQEREEDYDVACYNAVIEIRSGDTLSPRFYSCREEDDRGIDFCS